MISLRFYVYQQGGTLLTHLKHVPQLAHVLQQADEPENVHIGIFGLMLANYAVATELSTLFNKSIDSY